jgi:hypothetical protein
VVAVAVVIVGVVVVTVVVAVAVVALVAVLRCDVFLGSNWTTSSFLINHGILCRSVQDVKFVVVVSCNGKVWVCVFFVYICKEQRESVY